MRFLSLIGLAFDWNFQPTLDKPFLLELARLDSCAAATTS